MSHKDFAFGRADFTVDCWVKGNNFVDNVVRIIVDFRSSTTNNAFAIYVNTAVGNTSIQDNSTELITGNYTFSPGTWYHLAVTRSGTSLRYFINGVQHGSTYTETREYDCGSAKVGIYWADTNGWDGWIDEFRVRIGEAVWTSNFTPPAAPYSEVLLLHANGTDASTTITDSSPQPKTVTVVGNAQLDTAQFKFGSASALFDGTGDYVFAAAANPRDLSVGTGDFTVDFWVRFNSLSGDPHIVTFPQSGTVLRIWYESSATVVRYASNITSSAGVVTTGVWYHIAVTRAGATARLFINGIIVATDTADTNNFESGSVYVGSDGGTAYFNGWLDEVRILKGKAAWTSNFAVPSHEYHMASVARERLLLHGDGADGSTTITDSSYWARNVVAVGNAQVDTAQKKFGTASLLFDGTGDYIIVSDLLDDFDIGNNDFTFDLWIRLAAVSATYVLLDFGSIDNDGSLPILYIHDSNTVRLQQGSAGANVIIGTTTLTSNTWYHVALTRASGVFRLFLNGVQEGSSWSSTISLLMVRSTIGADRNGAFGLNGWLDEIRLVNGTAHWTSNFLPWPSAYDAPANVLLLHANGADATRAFPDNNDIPRAHKITVAGDTRIDTAQSKFGGSSILFDGTGDYLTLDGSSDFAFGTGDWTIDFWVRFNSVAAEQHLINFSNDNTGLYPIIKLTSGIKFGYETDSGNSVITGTTTPTTNTWYHVAVVKSSGTTKLYVNGTSEGTPLSDSFNYLVKPSRPIIGINGGANGAALNGWLDEIRIKRGEAAWTSNFTAPSAAYNPSDGHLLIHGDGPNANVLMIADVGTAAGKTDIIVNADAQVDTAQQKFGTASALFDGTGDYLNVA